MSLVRPNAVEPAHEVALVNLHGARVETAFDIAAAQDNGDEVPGVIMKRPPRVRSIEPMEHDPEPGRLNDAEPVERARDSASGEEGPAGAWGAY